MPADGPPLRIFVAMPGSTMGASAEWSDIADIKKFLLKPVADRVGAELARPTELVIEKDKLEVGPIHNSMFREAHQAEVYIADLTGNNPNVYLELGVRWALQDRVTVPISQDVSTIKFNASGSRAVRYGRDPRQLEEAVHAITQAIVRGLTSRIIDSPVRQSSPLVTMSRSDLDRLEDELAELRAARGTDLIEAATHAATLEDAVGLLGRAVRRNPANAEAHLRLGVALTRQAKYPDAIAALRRAVALRDGSAEAWRELGVALRKDGQLPDAVHAYDRSVALDPTDPDAWAAKGGIHRSLARRPDGTMDRTELSAARTSYARASVLKPNDTYSLVNLARLDLLLSVDDPGSRPEIVSRLEALQGLARYAVSTAQPPDPWKWLDLADTLLLSGDVEPGLAEVRAAIEAMPAGGRSFFLDSAVRGWRELLADGGLDEETAAGLRRAIELGTTAVDEDAA